MPRDFLRYTFESGSLLLDIDSDGLCSRKTLTIHFKPDLILNHYTDLRELLNYLFPGCIGRTILPKTYQDGRRVEYHAELREGDLNRIKAYIPELLDNLIIPGYRAMSLQEIGVYADDNVMLQGNKYGNIEFEFSNGPDSLYKIVVNVHVVPTRRPRVYGNGSAAYIPILINHIQRLNSPAILDRFAHDLQANVLTAERPPYYMRFQEHRDEHEKRRVERLLRLAISKQQQLDALGQ